MNKLRLKSFFVLLVALLCVCTVLAAISGIYHANQLAAIAGSQGKTAINALMLQLTILVVFSLVIAGIALGVFQTRFFTPLRQLRLHIEAIAGGDLSQRIQPSLRDNELNLLYVSARRMQESLIRTMSLMRNLADEVLAETNEMVDRNNGLSTRVEGQAAALQQTAASMEQLASTVRQNADNAHQANQLAVTASEVAQRGGDAVGEVVNTMQAISASSNKISDIVGVIDSIAFQTNILALNAAVEAARAGEQGRGFAVVASEVRALAQRSAQAAREITDLIEDSVAKVGEGSTQVERAGNTMQEIVDSVHRVTDIMGEISAATIEQSSGIEQVNRAVNQMDHSTSQNAHILERATAAGHLLKNHASRLQENAVVYRLPGAEIIDLGIRKKSQPASNDKATQKSPALATKAPQKSAANENPSGREMKNSNEVVKNNNHPKGKKDHQLLRPDLSGQTRSSAEDDWEEF
ncbi:MAG TPA: methyl-accepting chemotaxis protein [Paenalcaligenes sp.]|nr:methyl-accepting chemotaxis protein [Paenalcaligenes sp.]